LEAVISHQRFIDGDINTGFIAEEYPAGFSGATLTSEITDVFLATAIFTYIAEQKRASSISGQITDQASKIGTRWVVSIDDKLFPILIKPVQDGYNIRQGYTRIYIRSNWHIGSHLFSAMINGRKVNVKIENMLTGYKLTHSGITVKAYVRSPRMSELEAVMLSKSSINDQTELTAPLAGQIIAIKVQEQEQVLIGQEMIVLTAMKMENIILAERTGKISRIFVKEKDQVSAGQVLIEFE
ncbi:MAG: biotin/lipoyl-containing protein, partial [Janthinobacterium lividum]